ncbi:MAG: ABC transporter permease, partial [Methanomassiliicoccales archaeon]
MKARNVWKVTKEGIKAQWPQRIIGVAIITFLIMALFGLTFENGPTADISADIVLLDQAEGDSASLSIIDEFGNEDVIKVERIYTIGTDDPLSKALDDLKDGDVSVVIVFGQNFTAGIKNWIAQANNGTAMPPTAMVVYLDGSNPIVSGAVQGEVQRAVQTTLILDYGVPQPVRMVPDIVYGEGTDMREYMAPGIATLLIFIMTMIPAMMSSNGLSKSLLEGRDKRSYGDVIAGQAMVTMAIGIVQVTTVILTLLMFSMIDLDSTPLLFAVLMLFTMASTGFGLMVGHFVGKKPAAGMTLLPLLLYPAILMSGLIISVSSIPEYLLPISYFFPLTYSIEAGRMIM